MQFSNAKLKPERLRQFSLGAVLEPQRGMNISVDYWNIKKTDLISTIGVDSILANLDKYGSLVHRDEDNAIDHIDLVKDNRGGQKVSGLDLGIAVAGIKSGFGTWGLRLNGTWTINAKQQTGNDDPYVSNLGHFVNDGVVQRWRHTVSADWELGNLGPWVPPCRTAICRATPTRPSSARPTARSVRIRCGT